MCRGGVLVHIALDLAIWTADPVAINFSVATATAIVHQRLFACQSALGAALPVIFLQCAATHARTLQFVLAKRAFDEIFADRVAALRTEHVTAAGIRQSHADDF